MKKVKLQLLAMCTAALTTATFYGCYKGELYDINEPENIQDRISQAAEENARKKALLDALESVEEPYQIGITGEFTNPWWTTFSKYYKLGKGDTLMLKFRNYSDCKVNWHNWVAMVTSDNNISDIDNGYVEYLGQRADRWDNVLTNNAVFSGNMTSLDSDEAWASWLASMNKADVQLTIIRDRGGKVVIKSNTKTSDGKEWESNQESGIDTDGEFVRVFIACEESYIQFYYSNKVGEEDPKSSIGEVDMGEDHFPVSIAVKGYPTALELGDEDFWKDAEAIVTLDNGATVIAKKKDITFNVVPDLTSVGTKTIVVSYSKTKKGNYGPAVATTYNIDVTAPIQSIEIEAASKIFYYKPGTTTPPTKDDIDITQYIKNVLGKTSTTDIIISPNDYTAEITTVPSSLSDKIVITVTYKEFNAKMEVSLQEESYTEISHSITGEIGSITADYSSSITDFVELGSGESVTFKFAQETSGENQWNSWVVLVRDADNNDKVALRPDNWDNVAGTNAVGITTTLTTKSGEIDDDWFKDGKGMANIIKKANCEITFKYLQGVVYITTKTVADGTSYNGTEYDGYTYTTTYSPTIGTEKCKVAMTIDHAKLSFE
ncbi:MAG: hypothetical protein PUC50_15175 [Bacteroidales bacterium]|nr:hypothetical protein [Bacteroidales bacterium]